MPIKPRYVALTFSGLIILFSAILLWSAQNGPNSGGANMTGEPRHPVSADMLKQAEEKERKLSPLSKLPLSKGGEFDLVSALKTGPVVVVFTKEDCPCSMESQPVWNEMSKNYAGKATFVGITKNSAEDAQKFAKDFAVPYEFALDKDQKVIKAFGAINSVYVALIDQKGTVLKLWPGYSQAMVTELNKRIAELAQIKAAAVSLENVPTKLSSGCSYAD